MTTAVQIIDAKILKARQEFRRAKSTDEAFEKLQTIDTFQRFRHSISGRFLPCSDGEVWYYDRELARWFRLIQPLETEVG